MTQTRFGPLPPHVAARCAPTELDDQTGAHLKGIAHDFSARLLGGGWGSADAFSTRRRHRRSSCATCSTRQ